MKEIIIQTDDDGFEDLMYKIGDNMTDITRLADCRKRYVYRSDDAVAAADKWLEEHHGGTIPVFVRR